MFNLFRKKAASHPLVQYDGQQTYHVRVRTKPHREIVEVRFTRSAHIGIDDDGNYIFRKPIVSPQHFDRGELAVHFDRQYGVVSTEAENLEFIPVAQWE